MTPQQITQLPYAKAMARMMLEPLKNNYLDICYNDSHIEPLTKEIQTLEIKKKRLLEHPDIAEWENKCKTSAFLSLIEPFYKERAAYKPSDLFCNSERVKKLAIQRLELSMEIAFLRFKLNA